MSQAVSAGKAGARPKRIRLDNELVLAGLVIVAITGMYLLVMAVIGLPAAGSFFGHSIGIMGFLLMVATETLYSWRKRTRRRALGRMSSWLKFHIFTGLVGPYMVFLHAAWKFQGLAGLTLLMTAVVVFSGFFGRYIYTAVPRTVDGAVLERSQIERMLNAAEADLARIQGSPPAQRSLREPGALRGTLMVLGRFAYGWAEAVGAWVQGRRLSPEARKARARIDALTRRRNELQRQLRTLAAARRLMANWHTLHVPLGLTMFSVALIHVGAAIYYATLLK